MIGFMDDGFESYHVCDSDGNQIGSRELCHHPDEVWRLAISAVRGGPDTWGGKGKPDLDCYQIVGNTSRGGPIVDGVEGLRREVHVTLLLVRREGPPGSSRVRFESPTFPWLYWIVD